MKYAVVTNGKMFGIRFKYRWWPYWFWVKSYDEGGGAHIAQFETREKAQRLADRWQQEYEDSKKPWKFA